MSLPELSIVTSLYYSQTYINEFYQRCKATCEKLQFSYEIIFVNDGSPDDSHLVVLDLIDKDPHCVLIDLSRNFGHHQALLTGLEHALGKYIFLIDVDLEEEPELLELYWSQMQQSVDYDVVFGIQHLRKGGWFERVSGKFFYKIFKSLAEFSYPADTLTARLMTRRYVQSVLLYKEKSFDLWYLFEMAGFQQRGIKVNKGFKGVTTYNFQRKLKMAVNTITSASSRPLYFVFTLGIVISLFSFAYLFWLILQYFLFPDQVAGWTTTVASIWAVGGILTLCIGIIGIYLSKIFIETKQRPHSIIKNIYRKS